MDINQICTFKVPDDGLILECKSGLICKRCENDDIKLNSWEGVCAEGLFFWFLISSVLSSIKKYKNLYFIFPGKGQFSKPRAKTKHFLKFLIPFFVFLSIGFIIIFIQLKTKNNTFCGSLTRILI